MNYEREPAFVRCVIKREKAKAILIRQNELEVWLLRSQCFRISKIAKDDDGIWEVEIEMPEWLAEEKGLIYQ